VIPGRLTLGHDQSAQRIVCRIQDVVFFEKLLGLDQQWACLLQPACFIE